MTLRETFEQVPELYDRVRPGYPDALFDDLADLTSGSRVLEIGCGTGQATVSLARRGYEIVAVELGARLAELARRKLAPFSAVTVVNAAFEAWPLPAEPFDIVLAATSFHWIDPEVRVRKAAEALRPRGALAVVSTHHVAGGDERFFADVQGCYEHWDPATPPGLRLPAAADVPLADLDQAVFRRYEHEITYATHEYRDLLLSYSGHRALEPAAREGLLSCITQLIDERHGGRVTKRYMNELAVAVLASCP
jgi:SAM-dependent methyltransferase